MTQMRFIVILCAACAAVLTAGASAGLFAWLMFAV
jgi:hypothetical protein